MATGERWWQTEEGRRGGDSQQTSTVVNPISLNEKYTPKSNSVFNPNGQSLNTVASSDPFANPNQTNFIGESGGDWVGRQVLDLGSGFLQALNSFSGADPTSEGYFDNDPMGILAATQNTQAEKAKKVKPENEKLQADIDFRETEADWKNARQGYKDKGFTDEQIAAMRPTRDEFGKTISPSENNKDAATVGGESTGTLAGSLSPDEITDEALWNIWYGNKENAGEEGATFKDITDFQFNGSPEDWMDFMMWADREAPGMYTGYLQNALGDYYGFNSDVADEYTNALNAYTDYFNGWKGDHTVSNMFADMAIAQDILGTYYNDEAQYNAMIDYLLQQYPGANINNGALIFSDDNARAIMNQMFANTALAGQLGTKVDESKLDALGTLYDQYGLDYGLIDDQNFTAAGMDPYLEQLQEWAYTQDLMNPELYKTKNQGDISQGALAQMIMANDLGYGSNMTIDPKTWEALIG